MVENGLIMIDRSVNVPRTVKEILFLIWCERLPIYSKDVCLDWKATVVPFDWFISVYLMVCN